MRIVLAPDSFKESMTAAQAAAAMARGVVQVLPEAQIVLAPMADGGEGTTQTVVDAQGGRLEQVLTTDALGRPIQARIGVVGELGVIEVAAAVGLELIVPADRSVMTGTSQGVADLIRAACDAGCRRLIIGLGGSATIDGGAGLLVGLGAVLLDDEGVPVPPVPSRLADIARLDLTGVDPRLRTTEILLATDVTAPLLGPTGASAVFGPQKGATAAQVVALDVALTRWADAVETAVHRSLREIPGAGAAGGLGLALLALGAVPRRGVQVVAEAIGLDQLMAHTQLVLTGEGTVDAQTLTGKVPAGVAEIASRHGVPVLVFAGRIGAGAQTLLDQGVMAVIPITPATTALEQGIAEGQLNLERAVADALRALPTN